MFEDTAVAVLVPAYNEADHVGGVLDDLPGFVDRVYAVDDASTDDTWRVLADRADVTVEGAGAAAAAAAGPLADGGLRDGTEVVAVRHAENRGAGGALKTGYRHARADDVDVVVTVDGDGQMDTAEMDRLVAPVARGEADYAKADRLADAEYREGMPAFREAGNWMLTYLTRIASGYWTVSDPQNGYTAMSGAALDAIDLDGMYEYYGYCNDVLVRLNAVGATVADVPMRARYGDEESSIQYREYVPRVSGMLLGNYLWRLREEYLRPPHPVAAFTALAAVLGVAGVLDAGRSLADGDGDTGAGRGAGAFLAGCLAWLAGAALDARANADSAVDVGDSAGDVGDSAGDAGEGER